jgi:hypothetical protein
MNSVIEFQTQVTDGVILIPEQYKSSLNLSGNVRVIVIQQDAHQTKPESSAIEINFLQEFLDNPTRVENFVPLTRDEIYEH